MVFASVLSNLFVATLITLLILPSMGLSQPATSEGPGNGAPPDLHKPYDILLRLYVVGTRVNYDALASNPDDQGRLRSYIEQLESLDPGEWDGNDALAYWINLYNAATLELIIKNYPVKSIKDIGGFFSSPWNEDVVVVAGNPLTLNQIENEIIRPTFKDSRIHFALNCAAISCPPLVKNAFVGEMLDEQLDQAVTDVLNNDLVIEMSSDERWIDIRDNKIYVTKIFDWYKKDFAVDGGIRKFIARYRPQDEELVMDENKKLHFMDYDWNLNIVEKETASR